jgi:hypothetical protein
MHRRFSIRRLTRLGRLVHVWILVAAEIFRLWPTDWTPWT